MTKDCFHSPIYALLLIVTLSCKGQNNSVGTNPIQNEQNQRIAIGDTVSYLDKSIWILFQDNENRYWFGTNGQGVYRYDGKTILHYTTKHGLLNDSIRGIQGDKAGNIFISSLGGINKFDGETFDTLPVLESNEWRLDPNDMWFAFLGKSGESGPYRYDGKTLHHLKFPKNDMEDAYYAEFGKHPWSPYDPYTIYKDRSGNIWIGTAELGLCQYDGKTIRWLYEKHLTLIEGGGSFGIRSIIEDKDGKFWFCNTRYRYNILLNTSDDKLLHYKRENGIEDALSPEGKDRIYFMSAVEDNEGDLWMLTYEQGIWRYDGKKLTHYPIKDGERIVKLFSMYKDHQGDLWLCSHEDGAFKFNGKTFQKFKPNLNGSMEH